MLLMWQTGKIYALSRSKVPTFITRAEGLYMSASPIRIVGVRILLAWHLL